MLKKQIPNRLDSNYQLTNEPSQYPLHEIALSAIELRFLFSLSTIIYDHCLLGELQQLFSLASILSLILFAYVQFTLRMR